MQPYNPSTYVATGRTFPRVAVPGVDRDRVADLNAEIDFHKRQRMGFILSFMARGITPARPISGDVRKARRAVNKRQRAARKLARR